MKGNWILKCYEAHCWLWWRVEICMKCYEETYGMRIAVLGAEPDGYNRPENGSKGSKESAMI